ncbi:gluconate 2-dehydrogenase subunit 3 family protein [Nocardioides sp.]|uniref:gluconate 2-dehydrogenase subunit 3 family protein n=1 Tax=Nocardioides sp. TaxID=35761 RepID=UPI002B26B3D2|nr:gluconate 2-dehydrogenase subunit 3 family protein [Nocardioides sp.]
MVIDLPDPSVSRRALLASSGGLGAVAVLGTGANAVALPLGADRARFLSPAELATLRGVVDRVVPGRPEDSVDGAVTARVHHAIDSLLGAFETDPPRIYAGGPFSRRGGAKVNDFARFVELDDYERLAWRLRLHGSRGRARLQRNGATPGLRRVYRRGLRRLAANVPGFAGLPGPARDLALRLNEDSDVQAMLDVAVPHTLEFLFGAPEYGGNHRQKGWKAIGFDGDRQPRGYTRREVTQPETELLPVLDVPLSELLGGSLPLIALAPSEAVHGLRAASEDSFAARQSEVQSMVAALRQGAEDPTSDLRTLDALTRRIIASTRTGKTS